MADASDSKSDAGNSVWVQVPSPALRKRAVNMRFLLKNQGFTALLVLALARIIDIYNNLVAGYNLDYRGRRIE